MSTSFTGISVKKDLATYLDRLAHLVHITRLPEETLVDFKKRVLDVYLHKGSATRRGLYNSMNRELGLTMWTQGILIDVLRDGDGAPINSSQGLTVSDRYLTLYTDQLSEEVDLLIDLHERPGNYFIYELLDTINATDDWTAIAVNLDDYAVSSHLAEASSRVSVPSYQLRSAQMNTFEDVIDAGNYLVDDFLFTEETGLEDEVLVDPVTRTEYKLNLGNGTLTTYSYVNGKASFSYQAFPLMLWWSPVRIGSFKNADFLTLVTEAQTDNDGNTIQQLPTATGANYINEILGVDKGYWGV